MNKKPLPVLLLVCLIVFFLFGLIGQYVGAKIFIGFTHVNAEPSLSLLWQLWQHQAQLSSGLHTPLTVSLLLAAVIAVAPVAVFLMAALLPEKRELHCSARFANKAEIARCGLLRDNFTAKDYPDLLIGKLGKQYLRWSSNTFLYLAAPTRSGKGVGIVIPNCLHYRGSLVVYDPKLENFLITAGFRSSKLKQEVYLFNPAGQMPEHASQSNAPLRSHRWNPLTYIRRDARYMYKDAMKMADILIPKPVKDNGSATFFAESAQKLFTGLVLYLLETEELRDLSDPAQRSTLANLFRLTAPATGQPLVEWLKEEIERLDRIGKPLSRNCKTLLYGFTNGNAKTGSDILATLTSPLGIFIDPVVEAATSGDDFLLTDVRKKRMTIYVGVIPTDTGPFSRLTNLFFSQLISETVQSGLPENIPDAKYQCTLLMDEFTALGVIPAVSHGVSYIAGYGLRLLIIIQSPSQVVDIYGRDAARTFFTNFDCHIVYTPANDEDAKEYSEMIGYETYKAKSISQSSGKGSSRSRSESDQRRAVMLPQELKLMPQDECIISMARQRPMKVSKIRYYEDPVLKERANLAPPQIPELDMEAVGIRHDTDIEMVHIEPVPTRALTDAEKNTLQISETANAPQLTRIIINSLIPEDSPPEYIVKIRAALEHNLGPRALRVFYEMLG